MSYSPPTDSRHSAPARKRKSRWSDAPIHYTSSLSVLPKHLPGGLTPEQEECLAIRMRIEELTKKMSMNDLDMDWFREKEASPEPVYDNQGKRMNTRDQRRKDSLAQERQLLVEIAFTMNPNFKPPADYTSASIKRMKKMFIPVDKYPEYNFIGLIIGPRGNTQKRMEKETGCKILIRGRGSVKEGKSGMRNGKSFTDDEPLHVLITADNDVQLGKAAKMIGQLLVPIEDEANEHKARQLIELAKINGTLRDQSWRHPDEAGESFTRPNIKCAICLETSHPTIDCPLRDQDGKIKLSGVVEQAMSSEFDKFLNEIGDSKADAYDEFMQSISDVNKPPPPVDPAAASAPWAQPGAFGTSASVPWAQPGMGAAPWAQPGMGMPPMPMGAPMGGPPGMGAPMPQGYPPGVYVPPMPPRQS